MNIPFDPWIIALAVVVLLASALLVVKLRKPQPAPLPTDWALTARPVFTTDERRVYRLLREALPHHVILSKLPLVRFCQPLETDEVRYWYDLLGTIHATFAICSANGRVLAAIDLDAERGTPRRTQQIKQSVLSACRVRYLRCAPDRLPSIPELQLLVPHSGAAVRAPHAAPAETLDQARDTLSSTVAHKRAQRTALWQDSTLFQDSFFAPDSRLDVFGTSDHSGLASLPDESNALRGRQAAMSDNSGEVAGVVVDGDEYATSTR